MSRDLTPREMYTVEQHNIRNGLGSLWDFMKNTVWVINGVRIPLCTEDTLSRRQEYPLLGRFYERFDELYAFLSELDCGKELLGRYEAELRVYIETGKGDKNSDLLRWFEGELDEGFYYREHNDELLMESIQNEAKALPRLQEKCSLDSQIRDANTHAGNLKSVESPTHEDPTH